MIKPNKNRPFGGNEVVSGRQKQDVWKIYLALVRELRECFAQVVAIESENIGIDFYNQYIYNHLLYSLVSRAEGNAGRKF